MATGSIWDDYLQNLQTGWSPPPGIEGYASGGWSTGGNKAWREAQGFQRGTDTVHAMLTPKEAVLNRNASELIGRNVIKKANAYGNMLANKGVDLAGYQMGTSDVGHEDQGESMMKSGYKFTPQDLAEIYRQNQAQGQVRRAQMMNEKPIPKYQTGTSNVRRDDRGDLLKDADSTFYGGGQAPAPTPTPTPARKYQSGTEEVDPVEAARRKRFMSRFTYPAVSQFGPAGAVASNAGLPFTNLNPTASRNTAAARNAPVNTPAMNQTSQYQPGMGMNMGATAGQMFQNQYASMFNPQPQQPQQPQLPSGVQQNISPEYARDNGLQWGGRSWLPYTSPQEMTDKNLMYVGGQPSGSANEVLGTTTHFLPPGFTATTGSTGVPNSSPNDIHFLPPGFSSVQGVTNPQSKQLQFQLPGIDDLQETMRRMQGGY